MSEILITTGIAITLAIWKASLAIIYHAWITEAILEYRIDCRCNGRVMDVDFTDMEPMWKTFLRFWDWGYTHILPKEKYLLVKAWVR